MISSGLKNCPVKSFEKYKSVLNPKIDRFFQRPKRETPSVDGTPWFDASPLGKNKLGTMMKEISNHAKLSVVYTNHSIRATSVTILDQAGCEARHIMSVSGHRSESSIRSYARTGVEMKEKMSSVLSSTMNTSEPESSDLDAVFSDNFDMGVEFSQIVPANTAPTVNVRRSDNQNAFIELLRGSNGGVQFNNCTFSFN